MLGRVAIFKFNFGYMAYITLCIMDVINNPFNAYIYFGKYKLSVILSENFFLDFIQRIPAICACRKYGSALEMTLIALTVS